MQVFFTNFLIVGIRVVSKTNGESSGVRLEKSETKTVIQKQETMIKCLSVCV